MARAPKTAVRQRVRCAIYTRKSTEDGLEQDYNSLDAQRDACAAYIASQRHEGWIKMPDAYDDGGFSGGNMERPALKRLLAEVAAKRVDVIVIYKVDRLTRSLADFAKIVDVLDGAGASFVSVTQSFNTTSSMGRLTLNMLLSFAQFEREVTGERIRDKIAASKRKGIWMGGPVPLGYDVDARKLVVNEPEAELVRHIYKRYLELPSVASLVDDLNADGHRTKVQQRASGPHRGGGAFARGTLYHLLANPIYRGKIVHKGEEHPGEHSAIVDEALWTAVQSRLNQRDLQPMTRSPNRSALTGLLTDGVGRPMTPTHATKGQRRYRYYATREATEEQPAWRVSAADLEQIVTNRITSYLTDPVGLGKLVTAHDPRKLNSTLAAAQQLATNPLAADLIRSVALAEERVDIVLSSNALLARLGIVTDEASDPILLSAAVERIRTGHQLRLVLLGDAEQQTVPNEGLVQLLADAQATRALITAHPELSTNALAKQEGRCRKRLAQLFRVSLLAPQIVTAILDGRQPIALTAAKLLQADLPPGWAEQMAMLGVD